METLYTRNTLFKIWAHLNHTCSHCKPECFPIKVWEWDTKSGLNFMIGKFTTVAEA